MFHQQISCAVRLLRRCFSWMLDAEDKNESRQYDLLLLTVTKTEQEQLLEAATELGIKYSPKEGRFGHELYDFGHLGSYRVAAIRSRMGALDYGGSASAAQIYRAETGATGIIAVGMAFGISDSSQKMNDVLVSEGLFPYDDRDVVTVNGKFEYRYAKIDPATNLVQAASGRECARFRKAKPSLVNFFQSHVATTNGFQVHFGALLSGSARIHSAAYRDMLYGCFSHRGKQIVGGEMEAVGLLSCSDPKKPWWIVIKGISDFADERRDDNIELDRKPACRNAARFVLASLLKATVADKL